MRVLAHFFVLLMLLVFVPAHLVLSLAGVFSRRILPVGGTRRRRWKSLAIHGDQTFRWSWWGAAERESAGSVLRLIFLLEIGDLLNRVARRPVESPRLLALQVAHIGDLVISFKALSRLHVMWKDRMTLVVGPWNEKLAKTFLPKIKTETYSPTWRVINRQGRVPGFWSELALLLRWRREGVGTVLNFGPAWPFNLLISVFARPDRYNGQERDWWSMYEYARTRQILARGGNAYAMADEMVISGNEDISGYDMEIPAIRPEILAMLPEERTFICVGVGAGWPGKAWPVENFAGVLSGFCRAHGCHVVFLGSDGERELAERASGNLDRAIVHNLCGCTALADIPGIMRRAQFFFGNDSGLLHFAALAGIPTLALFLPGASAAWNPPGDQHVAIEAPGECPCARYQQEACRQPHDHCMSRIREKEINLCLDKLGECTRNPSNPSCA